MGNVDEGAPFWSELEIWEVLEGESEAVNLINHLHLLLLLLQNYIIIIEYIYIRQWHLTEQVKASRKQQI